MKRYSNGILTGFLGHSGGNMSIAFAMILVPIALAMGVAVDFSSAINKKSSMQNGLDAAILAIATLPRDMTFADREATLKQFYAGSKGLGTAKLDNFTVGMTGAVSAAASATYDMPTSFMQIASSSKVPISVATSINKQPTLIEAKFEIVSASGWWNKTMSLYGRKFGETTWKKLMDLQYVYNNGQDPKGYGTSTSYTVTQNAQGEEVLTQVQQQACTTVNVSNFNNLPAGAITGTYGTQKKKTTCTTTNAAGTDGAKIDVSGMEDLYLEMYVPSGSPQRMKSNDAATSNRLYLDTVEVPSGTVVNVFEAVPCGQTSNQAWEDGGNAVPAPVSNADFFYKITGKCGYTQRPAGIRLTQ